MHIDLHLTLLEMSSNSNQTPQVYLLIVIQESFSVSQHQGVASPSKRHNHSVVVGFVVGDGHIKRMLVAVTNEMVGASALSAVEHTIKGVDLVFVPEATHS